MRPDTAVCLVTGWRHRETGTRVSLVNDGGQPVVVGIDPPLRGRPPLAWCDTCGLTLVHPAAPDLVCRHLLAAFACPPGPPGGRRRDGDDDLSTPPGKEDVTMGHHGVAVAASCTACSGAFGGGEQYAPGRHMAIIHGHHVAELVAAGWELIDHADPAEPPDIICPHYRDLVQDGE